MSVFRLKYHRPTVYSSARLLIVRNESFESKRQFLEQAGSKKLRVMHLPRRNLAKVSVNLLNCHFSRSELRSYSDKSNVRHEFRRDVPRNTLTEHGSLSCSRDRYTEIARSHHSLSISNTRIHKYKCNRVL